MCSMQKRQCAIPGEFVGGDRGMLRIRRSLPRNCTNLRKLTGGLVRIRRTARRFVSPCCTIPQSRFACQLPLHKGAFGAVSNPAPSRGAFSESHKVPIKRRAKGEQPQRPCVKGAAARRRLRDCAGRRNDVPQSRANSWKLPEKLCESIGDWYGFVEAYRGIGANS